MTEPFTNPPPLGDDIVAKTHQHVRRLRARRRAGLVGGAAFALFVLVVAAATIGGNDRDTKVHVAGAPEGSSSSSQLGGVLTTRPGTHPSSTSAPHRTTPGVTTPSTPRNSAVVPDAAPDITSATNPQQTSPPATVTTTSVWNPADVCVPGPQGTTITLTPTVQAQPVGPGKWHLSGTITFVNASPYDYYSTGYLYITGTTIPGGTGESWVGWMGSETVLVGSGVSAEGLVRVPAGRTLTVPLDQTLHTDGNANADAQGTVPPTTIHQGKDLGTFGRWVRQCSNLPTIVTKFPIGGSSPS